MKKVASFFLLATYAFVSIAALAQAPPAKAASEADKQIAALQAKLMDWPELDHYKSENAGLPPPSAGERRVVFFGDSITAAWGRWPGMGPFFPGKAYVNRGIGGQTTAQMVVRFRQDVVDLHASAVVILAGTNDVAGNTGPMTPEMTEDNFRSMVEIAKANGIKVILASILPAADFPWHSGLQPAAKIRALNGWLRSYCMSQGLVYLDYYTPLADAAGGMKPGLSIDGVHPTEKGYAIMTPLAQAAIDKALGN